MPMFDHDRLTVQRSADRLHVVLIAKSDDRRHDVVLQLSADDALLLSLELIEMARDAR